MPATGFRALGGSVTTDRLVRKYFLEGVTSEADIYDWIANGGVVPSSVAGLPRGKWTADEFDADHTSYDIEVPFGSEGGGGGGMTPDSTSFRFNYQMPGGKFKQSLATIAKYYDDTLLPFGAGDFGGAINVVWDGGKQRCEGFDVSPPPEVYTVPYRASGSVVTAAWRKTLMGLCGRVNNAGFMGHAAGEIILVRVTGGPVTTGSWWDLELGFGFSPNVTDLLIGDINTLDGDPVAAIAKDGFDLAWVYYLSQADEIAKCLIQKPAAVHIERVFERVDFNVLNMPAFTG